MDSVYTMRDWQRDGVLKIHIGQLIDHDVYEQLRDSVPPAYHSATLFQAGEPYDHNEQGRPLYQTFVRSGENYEFIGLRTLHKTK